MITNPKIEEVIENLSYCISNNQFIQIENELVELKTLSTAGEWNSLCETICAFLNTNGGFVFCGVKEIKNIGYELRNFDTNNEQKLRTCCNNTFKDDDENYIDVSENLFFSYKLVNDNNIAVVEVLPLSKEKKFIKYRNVYYKRVLEADTKIGERELLTQKEYKIEYTQYSKELVLVNNSSINDLDENKINDYVVNIRKIGINETIKKSLEDSKDFLIRKYCIRDNTLTTLGILLFGKDPFQKIEYRAEVDCYFDNSNEIAKDDKIFKNDVLTLIDQSFNFVWQHIKVGRTQRGGGNSLPEYPEKLIKEIINNAVAHRNYNINRFITIKVNPGVNLSITNPGSFKQKMLILNTSGNKDIRRIRAGIVETQNPKLADILKTYKKMESQGIGISTLVTECLENKIDVPYYNLQNPDEVTLTIPSGNLIDEEIVFWLNSYEQYISNKLKGKYTNQHKAILAYLYKSEKLNKKRFYTILLNESNNHFEQLNSLKEVGLITEYILASSEEAPVYVLNADLTKDSYLSDIKVFESFPISLEKLDEVQIEILNILAKNAKFNNKSLKPNLITPHLYYTIHGKVIDPKVYESLGRKVRKVCADFSAIGVLKKDEKNAYTIEVN